ncbi:MAG UNVERIFIED_CONTAM: universal stress protein [Anaerolineae bacterium]|jgi:nucleotide-binding universal stress UspA family protein
MQGRYKKIVVPIDGSGLSQRAIPHAVDIARANQSEIILLHVFRPPAREYANIIALAGQESQMDVVREQTKQYLIGLRTELRDEGIECRVQMIEGASAAHLIVDYINGEEVDLVVMSTRGHTGLARMVFGSVANTVMQSVRVPCMLIYPDDETSENNSNG